MSVKLKYMLLSVVYFRYFIKGLPALGLGPRPPAGGGLPPCRVAPRRFFRDTVSLAYARARGVAPRQPPGCPLVAAKRRRS